MIAEICHALSERERVREREREYYNDGDKHFKSAGLSMYLTSW